MTEEIKYQLDNRPAVLTFDQLKNWSLYDWEWYWEDKEDRHRFIYERFTDFVNDTPSLKAHRDWIEHNCWGLGERAFQWAWKLVMCEFIDQEEIRFLEIGVHRGQITSLIGMLGEELKVQTNVFGISPFNGHAMGIDGTFREDTNHAWRKFVTTDSFSHLTTFGGLSNDESIVYCAKSVSPFDIIYIDGDHSYEVVKEDLKNYLPMLKAGGILVTDDSGNRFKMPWGFFQGIESCSRAIDEVLPPFTESDEFQFLFNVMHLRIFQKVATV